jgi:hypothetical protein
MPKLSGSDVATLVGGTLGICLSTACFVIFWRNPHYLSLHRFRISKTYKKKISTYSTYQRSASEIQNDPEFDMVQKSPSNSPPLSSYSYQKLERTQIRMLHLSGLSQPSLNSDHINCRMEQLKSHQAAGSYIALSYRWGDWNDHKYIALDDEKIPVTYNLYDALQQLQHLQFSRIWVPFNLFQ